MSLKISIENPDISREKQTYLAADFLSGSSLTVRNNDGITADYFVVVGEPTQEQTEVGSVNTTTGYNTVVLDSALRFSHPKSCPVYQSQWDKVSVERKTSSLGSFSAISGSPFVLTWDDPDNVTLVKDPTGNTAYIYRWRFYNSNTGDYSSYSGELDGTGLSRNQAGYIIQKVRRNKQMTDGVEDQAMFEYMTDLQDVVYEQIPEAWWFEKEGTPVATVADTYKYSITTNWPDLLSINTLLYRFISGDIDITYPIDYRSLLEFYNLKADSSQQSDDHVTCWTLLPKDASDPKGYIGLHTTPDTTACYIKPIYSIELTDVSSFDDELLIPKPKIYEDYVLYRIADDIKGDQGVADKYQARVEADIKSLKKRAKRQLGQKELLKYRGPKGYKRLFNGFGYLPYNDRVNYW